VCSGATITLYTYNEYVEEVKQRKEAKFDGVKALFH
jgi:hypothetical protein